MQAKMPWGRVFAEGVVIVGSILLAFAIDAWWERTKEQQEALAMLEQLHADLVADTASITDAFRFAEYQMNAATWLLDRWDDPDPPMDSVAAAFRTFGSWSVYQPRDAAFASLTEADRLRLIPGDSLRLGVVSYFSGRQAQIINLRARIATEREALLRVMFPYVRYRFRGAPGDGQPGFLRVERNWGELTSDLNLHNQISLLYSTWRSAVPARGGIRAENQELRLELLSALAR